MKLNLQMTCDFCRRQTDYMMPPGGLCRDCDITLEKWMRTRLPQFLPSLLTTALTQQGALMQAINNDYGVQNTIRQYSQPGPPGVMGPVGRIDQDVIDRISEGLRRIEAAMLEHPDRVHAVVEELSAILTDLSTRD